MSTAAETTRAPSPAGQPAARVRQSRSAASLIKLPFWLLVARSSSTRCSRSTGRALAFTPEVELFTRRIKYFPAHPTLENFRDALRPTSSRRAAQLDDRGRLGDADLARDRRARRLSRSAASASTAARSCCT
jgi:hypothetical protein